MLARQRRPHFQSSREVRMKRSIRFTLLSLAIALAAPTAASADQAKKDAALPAMTPEQKMAMDAMAKAGTPGDAHAQLAKMSGSYDLEIKSWEKPGGEAMVEQGTATRSMALGGRVMVEMVTRPPRAIERVAVPCSTIASPPGFSQLLISRS